MKRMMILVFLASIALLLGGCGDKNRRVLAKVNDKVITVGEFNEKIKRLPKHYQGIMEKQKKKFLDEVIKEELLYKEALKARVDKDPETQEVIAAARKKILVSRLIKNRVEDAIAVSGEEIKKYYDEHSEEFMLPERWRASHILVDTNEEAEEIKEKVNQGAPFEELARNRSKDASAERGGDVGYFSKGQLIPDFEEACFLLEAGEVSDVVKTQFGYHIIKLTERKSPEVQEFSRVKELIKKELEGQRKKELFDELIRDLRNNAKISINEEFLEEITKKEAEGEKEAE